MSNSSIHAVQFAPTTDAGRSIVEVVTGFLGCELGHNEKPLRSFLARGIDNPGMLLSKKVSTCGLFALAVYHALEIQHHLASEPYIVNGKSCGKAITWLVQMAQDLEAIRTPSKDGPPPVGALCHYFHHGQPDDHVEFVMTPPQRALHQWMCQHAGGGRANCGIGQGYSNLLWSFGRPLQQWFDPDAMLGNSEPTHEINDTSELPSSTASDVEPHFGL